MPKALVFLLRVCNTVPFMCRIKYTNNKRKPNQKQTCRKEKTFCFLRLKWAHDALSLNRKRDGFLYSNSLNKPLKDNFTALNCPSTILLNIRNPFATILRQTVHILMGTAHSKKPYNIENGSALAGLFF